MHLSPSATVNSFRTARADLSRLSHAPHATIITDRDRPIAILTPIDTVGMQDPGPRDRRVVAARRLFEAAIDTLKAR